MKKFAICTVICLLLLSVNNVKADLMLTAVDGDWSNPTGPGVSTVSYPSVGSQDQIRWGNYPAGGEQSGLGFTGAATPSTIVLGDAFEIGQLAHFNNPIYSDSVIVSADLTINLTFSASATESFLFNFGINETPNTTDPVASADIISFPSSFPEQTFDIGGDLYTFQFLGFGSNAGSLLSEFSSLEDSTNETLLWGRIEPVLTPVPGAVLLGMLGLSVAGIKLRKYA